MNGETKAGRKKTMDMVDWILLEDLFMSRVREKGRDIQ